jgi:hypothetical protein
VFSNSAPVGLCCDSSDGAGRPSPEGEVGLGPSVRDGRGVDGEGDSDEHEEDGDGGDHGVVPFWVRGW